MAGNKIKRQDIVENEVFSIGEDYNKTIQNAVDANAKWLASFAPIKQAIKQLNDLPKQYKSAGNNQQFIAAKQNETKIINEVTAALKVQQQTQNNLTIATEREKQANSELTRNLAQKRVAIQQANAANKQQAVISSTLSTEYQKQSARLEQIRKAYKALAIRQELHQNLTKKEVAEMKRLEAQANKIDGALKKVDAAVGQSQRNVGNYSSAFKNLNGILRTTIAAFGLYSGIQIAKDIFNQIKEIDALNKALLKVTETQGRFSAEQAFLVDLAEEAGLGINVLQQAYTKFLASAKTTNLTIEETRNIFRQTAKAGAVLGLTADDITGSMRALEQILSKGKVQAEEIRGQLGERLPGAFQILARSMGLTTQQLSKQLELGNVISEEVLPKFAEELEKVYGLNTVKKVDTVIAAQNRLSNEWRLFITSVEDGEGVISAAFKSIVTEISETIRFYRELNNESEKFKPGAYTAELNDVRKQAELTDQTEKEIAERRLITRNEALKAAKDELDLKKRSLEIYKEETSTIEKVFPFSQKYLATVNSFKDDIEGKKENINLIKGQISALEELIGTKEKDNEETETSNKKLKEQKDFLFEVNKFINERKISALKEFAEDEKRDFDLRQIALQTQADLEIDLVDYVTTEKLKKVKKGSDEERLILIQSEAEKQDIIKRFNEGSDDLILAKIKANAETKAAIQEKLLNEELIRENEYFESTKAQYKNLEEATEAHEKRVADIKKKYAIEALNAQIKVIESLLSTEEFSADERIRLETKVAEFKKQISDLNTETYNTEGKKRMMTEEEVADAITNLSSQLAGTITDILNNVTQARIDNFQKEIDKSDDKYDKLLENENLYEEDRKRLEDAKENARKKMEREIAKERRKQAVIDKAAAVTDIAINTAVAVSKGFAQAGPIAGAFLTALTIAMGAAQIALVLSTPIPEYAKGTDNHKGGFALVGEERPEVIQEPGKKPYVVSKPTVLDLPKHTKVTPSVEEYEKLMRASILSSVETSNNKINNFQANVNFESNRELIGKLDAVKKAIEKSKPTVNFRGTKAPDLNHEIFKFKNNNWKV